MGIFRKAAAVTATATAVAAASLGGCSSDAAPSRPDTSHCTPIPDGFDGTPRQEAQYHNRYIECVNDAINRYNEQNGTPTTPIVNNYRG